MNENFNKGLILTSAVKSILSDYLKILDYTAQERATMFLNYFAEISGEKYPQLTDEQKQRQEFASTDEWIDDAIVAFNKKPVINSNSLMDMFEKAIIKKDRNSVWSFNSSEKKPKSGMTLGSTEIATNPLNPIKNTIGMITMNATIKLFFNILLFFAA